MGMERRGGGSFAGLLPWVVAVLSSRYRVPGSPKQVPKEKRKWQNRYRRTVRGMEAEAEAEAKAREKTGKLLYLAGESRCLRRRDGWVTDD